MVDSYSRGSRVHLSGLGLNAWQATMKLNDLRLRKLPWLTCVFGTTLLIAGCGPSAAPNSNAGAQALEQERERLRAENQGLEAARAENVEVQTLKRENQDLAKARSEYQEATRLRNENEQLRQQVAKLPPTSAAAGQAGLPPSPDGVLNPGMTADQEPESAVEVAEDEGTLHEGDDILVEPRFLKELMPEFDWEKLERTAPLAVRSLIERDGTILTNVSQLADYGITNFVIQRAIPPPDAPQPE